MTQHDHTEDTLPRRAFLKRSVTLVGAAGAGLAMAGAQAGEATEREAAAAAPETGYRESEHVRRYYRMADF